jgi:hypothetical protein
MTMAQDQSGADEPISPQPSTFLQDQQTRRRFLKAAVASGATVAAFGTMSAAAASASPRMLRQLRGQSATASGQAVAAMCVEDSKYNPITEFTVNSDGTPNPGTLFVWFILHGLPNNIPVTFAYTLTPTSGDNTTPFKLNQSSPPASPDSLNVFVFQPIPVIVCPPEDPLGGGTRHQAGHNISDVFPYDDVTPAVFQIRVEVQYNNGPIQSDTPYIFVGTLTNTDTLVSYTAQITVTAKKA